MTPARSVPTKRRTQAERTAETKEALLKAVLDAVYEEGWQGLRSAAISKRAGVSVGAQTHHFASKGDLVFAATAKVMDRYFPSKDEESNPDESNRDRLSRWLKTSWAFCQERKVNMLWLEWLVASRCNPELKKSIKTRDHDILTVIPKQLSEHCSESSSAAEDLEDRLKLTIYMMRGMLMEQALSSNSKEHDRLFNRWKEMAFPELGE